MRPIRHSRLPSSYHAGSMALDTLGSSHEPGAQRTSLLVYGM